MRPSKYLRWPARDRRLAEALLAYEDGLCPGCGNPRHVAWDPRAQVDWKVTTHTCEPCEVRANAAEGKPARAGQFVTVTPDVSVPAGPGLDGAHDEPADEEQGPDTH